MMNHHHIHDTALVIASVLIAAFASYTALDLANSVTVARGKARYSWLLGGSLAMGIGIWSMHFVGMLAFRLPGIQIAYDVGLLILSILVAMAASAIALWMVSRPKVTTRAYVLSSLAMAAAIAGMHYIGIASMRMGARWEWNYTLVGASLGIAVVASFAGLWIAFRLRKDLSRRAFLYRGLGGAVMGIAISGMHYTAMMAMTFFPTEPIVLEQKQLIATSGLAIAVTGTTILILGIALLGSIVDRALSRRQAMADVIQESETRLRIITNAVPAFIGYINRNFQFTFTNHLYKEWFGEHVGPGTFAQDILSPEAFKKLKPLMESALSGNETALTVDLPHPTLGIRSVEARYIPDREINQQAKGFFVLGYDVTEKNKNEQALREAIRARDEFLSVASHELKTPLTSLKLQAQLRSRNLEKGNISAFTQEQLNKMVVTDARQIDRLIHLVDDMLDISRINTGKLSIRREQLDLCELTREVLDRFQNQLESTGSTVTLDCGTAVTGNWDRFRLEQVLVNLFTNAMKYGAGTPIQITVSRMGALALLTVRDQGIGIAQENHDRIFQRFERAVSANQVSGLGLGLYIVRQIVEMHGGTIEVESELGKGSTFKVTLPLPDSSTPESSSRHS